MTVIAGLVDEAGTVHMAADTGSQVGGTIYHCTRKIFTLQTTTSHTVVFGSAGTAAGGALVRQHLTIQGHPEDNDTDRYGWATAIAEAVCGIAKAADPAPTDSDGWLDFTMLMGYDGRLWMLNQQCATELSLGYGAVGSGGDLATGVIHVLRGCEPPEIVLDQAVRTACLFDAGCTIAAAGPVMLRV